MSRDKKSEILDIGLCIAGSVGVGVTLIRALLSQQKSITHNAGSLSSDYVRNELAKQRGPANPAAIAEVIRGKMIDSTENVENVIKQVLGRSTIELAADRNSILYQPIDYILSITRKVQSAVVTPSNLALAAKESTTQFKASSAVKSSPTTTPSTKSQKSISAAPTDGTLEAIDFITRNFGCISWMNGMVNKRGALHANRLATEANMDRILAAVDSHCQPEYDRQRAEDMRRFDAICESDWKQREQLRGVTRWASTPAVSDILAQQTYERCDGPHPQGWNSETQVPCHWEGEFAVCDATPTSIPSGYRFPWLATHNNGFEFTPFHPQQGTVGNCGIISAMSSIAYTHPERLRTSLRDLGVAGNGARSFAIRMSGVDVILDDIFPMSPYTMIPLGVRSNYETYTSWPALFEKAWTKRITRDRTDRPYYGASSGAPFISFTQSILGGEYVGYEVRAQSQAETFRILQSFCDPSGKMRIPFCCSVAMTPRDLSALATDNAMMAVFAGHCYSIFGATEIAGQQAVIIRNPWGRGIPNASLLISLVRPSGAIPLPRRTPDWNGVNFNEDGVFAMKLSEFYRRFGLMAGVRV